jgi:hypothetical protein
MQFWDSSRYLLRGKSVSTGIVLETAESQNGKINNILIVVAAQKIPRDCRRKQKVVFKKGHDQKNLFSETMRLSVLDKYE